jgi:nitrite reductase/ring-hydroxylating ferredoxin subunit
MKAISRLEQAASLDGLVAFGQRVARLIPPGKFRDALHGTWLGHPLHPVMVQATTGTWLSASILDLSGRADKAARGLAVVGLAASAPTIAAGAADWSEQHEQQMRVGVIHALANAIAVSCYGSSLFTRSQRVGRGLRLSGLAALAGGALLGGHLSFRLAGGANHAEAVPHVVEPGWHALTALTDLPDGEPVRLLLGEVPLVVLRDAREVHVLADRCSHMSGPLADGDLSEGCVTCPWHGSVFRLSDGHVVRGPATAPQPVFESRVTDGMLQVRLPGAG